MDSITVQVPGLSGVTKISAGEYNVALSHESKVSAWGYNVGQLGDGTTTGSTSPLQVSGITA